MKITTLSRASWHGLVKKYNVNLNNRRERKNKVGILGSRKKYCAKT